MNEVINIYTKEKLKNHTGYMSGYSIIGQYNIPKNRVVVTHEINPYEMSLDSFLKEIQLETGDLEDVTVDISSGDYEGDSPKLIFKGHREPLPNEIDNIKASVKYAKAEDERYKVIREMDEKRQFEELSKKYGR